MARENLLSSEGSDCNTSVQLSDQTVSRTLLQSVQYRTLYPVIQLDYVHLSDVYKFGPYLTKGGARGSVVVKALCYKPEGRGFDSR
jgi:hypothetical protein